MINPEEDLVLMSQREADRLDDDDDDNVVERL